MTARWRLGTRNPFTVYRVADGAHDVDHARQHFVTAFQREEDADLAVDAVNAWAARWADPLSLDELTSAAEAAFECADITVEVREADGTESSLRRLVRCLRSAGLLDERRDRDDDETEEDARLAVDAVNAAAPDVAAVAEQYRILWGYDEPNDFCRYTAALAVRLVKLAALGQADSAAPSACDCPDTHGAEPAGSAVGQRGAPTRDARAEAWLRSDGVIVARANDGWESVEVVHERDPDPTDAIRLVPEAALRDGGADAGGEDDLATRYPGVALTRDSLRLHAEALTENVNTALREKREAFARLSTALGVSLDPDDPDPVGTLEAAAGKAREVEVVTSKQAVALPPGSWVLRCHQNGTPWLNASPRPADAIGSAGDPRWLVLYRAPAPAPAALAVGEVVHDAADLDRRASVGTIVEDASGDIDKHGPGGWRYTELAYPVTVVRVGTGGGESGE